MSQPPPTDFAVAPSGKNPSRRNSRRVFALIGVLLALGSGTYYYSQRDLESTDDAQVDAEVVPLPVRVAGVVSEVMFAENQPVKAGQVLAKLDDALLKAKVSQCEATLHAAEAAAEAAEADAAIAETNASSSFALANASLRTASDGTTTARSQIGEAEASLAGAEAAFRQATLDHDRLVGLFQSGATTQSAVDQSTTMLNVATANLNASRARLATLQASARQAQSRVQEANAKVRQTRDVDVVVRQARARAKVAAAQVQTAKAALDIARLDLSYATVVAPVDGVASKKTIVVGQNLSAGQPIAQLVTKKRWVLANLKETQLEHMREGQPVTLNVDAFPHHEFRGRVESLSSGTGSKFALIPPDNASGNFTKVVQRVPVRIAFVDLPEGIPLRPGMNVELTVDTRQH